MALTAPLISEARFDCSDVNVGIDLGVELAEEDVVAIMVAAVVTVSLLLPLVLD